MFILYHLDEYNNIFLRHILMKNLHQKAIEAYIEMLEIHIDTKTTDAEFHKETEEFYETLFEVAHKIWEKHVDLWWKLSEKTLDEKKQRANTIISNMRKDIESYHKDNEITLWTEDLLWSLANDIEDIEGSSKAFL